MPEHLIKQLAEGGQMVIPIGGQNSIQQFLSITKKDGKISEQNLNYVRYVPLTDLNKQLSSS
jgi:protein-L-isoaspartate O-methyltransferase